MNYSELQDYYPPDPDENESGGHTSHRWRRLRLSIFGLLMLAVLLFGMIYPAWQAVPWLLGYWNNSYSLRFTGIENGYCNRSDNTPNALEPGHAYCVCGYIDAQDHAAHLDLHIQTLDGDLLGKAPLHDRETGRFCQVIETETLLLPDRYQITAEPRLSKRVIRRIEFVVTDNRPDL